jgi:mannitol-1-phosphate/altronate dehydrogenase
MIRSSNPNPGSPDFALSPTSKKMLALRDEVLAQWSQSVRSDVEPAGSLKEPVLLNQGGRYTLETVSPADHYRYQQIQSIREVLPFEPSLASAIACGADPDTRIISFTVTEAGCYLAPQGRLDLSSPEVQADLARAPLCLAPPSTAQPARSCGRATGPARVR